MELWIRSQDREVLTKVINVYKRADTNGIWSCSDRCIKNCLGVYATKERAIEVLDEIQRVLSINFSSNGSYQEMDLQIKAKMIKGLYGAIYEMPEK